MSKKPKSATRTRKTATSAPKTVPKPATAKPKRPRAASKTSKPKPATAVIAQSDIGFGNQMFIRGEGPGLSWDHGLLMECQGSDQWHWACEAGKKPFAFKVLINDQLWAHGENDLARPGATNTIQPGF